MGRVTEKALRSRQYVFEGVSRDRRAAFGHRIRALREAEEAATLEARRAADERTRAAARAHAAGILRRTQGETDIKEEGKEAEDMEAKAKREHPVSKELSALNAELNLLTAERARLYEMLKTALAREQAGKSEKEKNEKKAHAKEALPLPPIAAAPRT
jgi:hypothetical protein